MNIRALRLLSTVGPLLLVGTATLLAQPPKKLSPTGKLFVADVTGTSQIDLGDDKIEPLAKDAVHAPEGAIIESKAESSDSLVFSNGTALYVAADTRFEVKKFVQEPFTPNQTDLDVEPSISQTYVRVVRGTVGLCTSRLVAGSSMVYQTPQATITIRGRRVLIQTDVNETRVTLLEGDVTVVGSSGSVGETLRPGQQAIARKTTDNRVVVTVQPTPEADLAKLEDLVALACISRRTVYFEAVDRGEKGQEIDPVRTTPAKPPTGFTISPSRIGD